MKSYLELLEDVLSNGRERCDRTGVGTLSVFARQLRFDLSQGFFPLLTSKRVAFQALLHELLWFISGATSLDYLHSKNVHIWDEWADEKGDLGPVYGAQWRSWPTADGTTIDQLAELLSLLKTQPYSRRLLISAWNVAQLKEMRLPPCHCLFQFYVNEGRLSCQLYQRSGDIFLGVPFNIASYSLLTLMIAQVSALEPGEFIHTFGDLHLYCNHRQQAKEQLQRHPRQLPKVVLNPQIKSLFDFSATDVQLQDYNPHPKITAPVAV